MDTKTRAFVELSPIRCPFCHDAVQPDTELWVACATCLARHHTECWDDAGACSACGRDRRLELAGGSSRPAPAPSLPVDATLVHVAPNRAGAVATIAEALRSVAPGGKVLVEPGVYRESLVLDRPVALVGTARGGVVIEAGFADGVRIEAEASLEHVTVRLRTRGLGTESWSALRITRGRARVTECDFESELLSPAVVVEGPDARPRLSGCRIDGKGAGVLVAGRGGGTLENCEISGHRHFCLGVKADADPEVVDCKIAGGSIGVLVDDGGRGLFRGCEVTLSRDAAVRCGSHAKPAFVRCRVVDAQALGVWALDQAEGSFEDCAVKGARGSGVLVERGADPLFRATKVQGSRGAGVVSRAHGRGRFEDCRIADNAGAGVESALSSCPVLTRCKVRGNDGPGVHVRAQSRAFVEKCDLTSNGGKAWLLETGAAVESRENVE